MTSLTPDLDIYSDQELDKIPIYTAAQSAHYLGLPKSTVRSWVFGRSYQSQKGKQWFQPLIKVPNIDLKLLSFINLVEIHTLSAIRRLHQINLEKVRQAIIYLENNLGTEHPLASQQLYTDGIDLFVKNLGEILNISRSGQLLIKEALEKYLDRIEWTPEGHPFKLYPFTRSLENTDAKLIVISPHLAFGQPVLVCSGVSTSIIAQRYKAGESIEELAEDYEQNSLIIQEVLRYELQLVA